MVCNPMRALNKISYYFARACFFVACLALVVMALHMFLDVVLRRLGIYFAGTLEYTSFYYMVFAVFLGLSYTQYKDKHISTDKIGRASCRERVTSSEIDVT